MFDFARPDLKVYALPLLALLVLAMAWSRALPGWGRRTVSWALRSAVLILCLLALALPEVRRDIEEERALILLVEGVSEAGEAFARALAAQEDLTVCPRCPRQVLVLACHLDVRARARERAGWAPAGTGSQGESEANRDIVCARRTHVPR